MNKETKMLYSMLANLTSRWEVCLGIFLRKLLAKKEK